MPCTTITTDAARVELVLAQLNELPALAPVAVRLLQITGQPDSAAQDVTRLIASDPPLAARIVSLAARAERASRVEHMTIDRATVMLGFRRVRQVVLATKVVEAFSAPAVHGTVAFDRRAFWTHCVATAAAAKLLAGHRHPPVDAHETFLAALLHDLGKIALATCMPRSYDRVVLASRERRGDILMLERELLGVDHTTAGRRLAQRWGLPESLTMCIWLHHLPPDALQDAAAPSPATILTWLADQLVRSQRLGYSGNHAMDYSLEEAARLAGVNPAVLDSVIRALPAELESVVAWAGLDDVQVGSMYADALARAAVEVSLLESDQAARQEPHAIGGDDEMGLAGIMMSAWSPRASLGETAAVAARAAAVLTGGRGAVAFVPSLLAGGSVVYGAYALHQRTPAFGAALIAPQELEDAVHMSGDGHAAEWPPIAAQGELLRWAITHGLETEGVACALPLFDGARLIAAIVVSAPDGTPIGLTPASTDCRACLAWIRAALQMSAAMTRSRELEEALVTAQSRLRAAQQALTAARSLQMTAELAAGAAHELNTPLAVIGGHAQIIRGRASDAGIQRSADAILTAANQASDVLTDLMRYSEPLPPAQQRLEVGALLHDWVEAWQREFPDVRLSLSVDARLPQVRCDARHLHDALTELVRNACEATAAQAGRIDIKLSMAPADDTLRIAVVDQGRGMTAAVCERAFAPFFSARGAGRGRGMGLSLAQRYMAAHSGRITLESESDTGTTATIHLPIATEGDS